MPAQRKGSAKRFFPYHNVLILHKSKNQTVKDQFNTVSISVKFLLTCWKRRRVPWAASPDFSIFLPPGLSRGTTWHCDAVLDKADDSWTQFIFYR